VTWYGNVVEIVAQEILAADVISTMSKLAMSKRKEARRDVQKRLTIMQRWSAYQM